MTLSSAAITRWDRGLRLGTLALVVVLALLSSGGLREWVMVATPPLLAFVSVSRLVVAGLAFKAGQPLWGPSVAEGVALGLLGFLTLQRDVESPLLLVVVALLLGATFFRRRLAERAEPDEVEPSAEVPPDAPVGK